MTKDLQREKILKRREKALSKEKLTNKYLIQFTWGVIGIIALLFVGTLYRKQATVAYMNTVNWILTGIFVVLAIALFVLGRVKNIGRASNYGKFMVACAGVTVWLALYNKIRLVAENILKNILNNPTLSVNSYWNTRIPIYAIIVYLVVAFIIYTVKINKK